MSPELVVIDAPQAGTLRFDDLLQLGGGGALAFRIRGKQRDRTRVAVTLLHGNEPSGVHAALRFINERIEPACDSLVVLGSLEAATRPPRFSHRFLPERRDRNRVFGAERNDVENAHDKDYNFARALLDLIGSVTVEALVDMHNNTGHNPPYGIILCEDANRLGLVSMFAERAILTDLRLGTLMEAIDATIPVVSIEAGRVGDPAADRVAYDGLVTFLTSPTLPVAAAPLELYSHPVRVELTKDTSVAFAAQPGHRADVVFSDMLDDHNFSLVAKGTVLGWVNTQSWPLAATDAEGRDVSRELFDITGGILTSARDMVPIMMTLDATVARQDCLFYVVHRGRP